MNGLICTIKVKLHNCFLKSVGHRIRVGRVWTKIEDKRSTDSSSFMVLQQLLLTSHFPATPVGARNPHRRRFAGLRLSCRCNPSFGN
ncbi:hypothetical protein L6452_38237 [Arctium lappa]|uniref:Uncharacterized protein n=1 Tax=Arctium lappa TaxID=4217 RepID=A0ACB8Y4D5_ARCLA|nr:hypothetical protein L6452_38237 [Arctium lappa]